MLIYVGCEQTVPKSMDWTSVDPVLGAKTNKIRNWLDLPAGDTDGGKNNVFEKTGEHGKRNGI